MRIGQRLGMGFGIVLLLIIGMTVFVSLSLNKIGKTQKAVASHATNVKTINTLKKAIERWLMTVEYILGKRDLSQLDYHEILEATIEGELNEIDWDIYGVAAGNLRDEITQTFNNIEKLDTTVQMYLRLGNKSPETINMDDAINSFEADASHITKSLANLSEISDTTYNQVLTYSKKTEKECWLSIYVFAPITVVFSIFYAFVTTRDITKPLNMLSTATEKIANGSFNIKLSIKSPFEMEVLSNAFNNMSSKLEESKAELERLSITDKLTDLYNRRHFDENLEKEVLRAKRFKHSLSLLFIDIDKFKHFNDTYGHIEGDKVLQCLGQTIKKHVRNGVDVECRYGGEEFTIILPETSKHGAFNIANRIQRDFKDTRFYISPKNETVQKTVSIGIAEFGPSDNAEVLLTNADAAMYKAKKLGGNTICEYRV